MRRRRLLWAAFGITVALTLFFALRATVSFIYWNDPARRELAVEGWMTPGYVARSWGVDRRGLAEALALSFPEDRGKTLEQIATERGLPLDALVAQVLAAIEAPRRGAP